MHLSRFVRMACLAVCLPLLARPLFGQHQGAPVRKSIESSEDKSLVQKGQAQFQSSCGFCHGSDATGSRAPDLVRSVILNHDEQGNLIGPVIRNGRPDKGMPSFATLKADQVAAIVAFLHSRAAEALHSGNVSGDYPLAKLLTGNAAAGKQFFNGTGGCVGCHSPSGDLAHIANKYPPLDVQQRMIYPPGKKKAVKAVVTTASGEKFEGQVVQNDEFNIGINCQDGWYRSWPRDQVQVDIRDPLAAHRELTAKYTDSDMHNVFAYLETLK